MQNFYRIVLVVLCSVSITMAQQIKTPSEFLGYELGTQFSRNHQVVDYFKHVASTMPNQVKLEQYGETYERRPLIHAYISSEENMKNLETIRENNLKNAGIMSGAPSNTDIVIVWLSYNVHGDEASSTEASMNTIYKLLTERQELLKNTVVIIDPCINPDGRDRYANWYNETKSTPFDIDPQSSEHSQPWPGGRANHYLFDLNRDWAWTSQKESIARIKVYNKWMPQIHVDFHEQGINSPYYFAPAAEPYHELITDWQRDFQFQIGRNHAKYFDPQGWLYFTRESFDLLYPSYGDTYPTYMGAIGMTYEQAGGGRGALGVKTSEGHVLTLKDRIAHHTTSGLSTVEISSKNASKLNEEFNKFFKNDGLKYKSYVMSGNPEKIDALKTLLDRHEIAYGYATSKKVTGHKYSTNANGSMNTTSNDLVVSTNQPKGKMIKALFEPNAKLSDSLTYDITAWSLPYAYGLETIASTSLVSSQSRLAPPPPVPPLSKTYGYVSDWNSLKDAKFLAMLLNKNIKVRFNHEPFSQNGNTFNRGSLIILQRDNTHIENFTIELSEIAVKNQQRLKEIQTGFSDKFPDMGSSSIRLINKTRIAMISGEGTSSLSYGATWHFFEQQLKYPVTSINSEDFGRVNLAEYDVLILPSGSYRSMLNDSGMSKLQDWMRSGGKVIAIDRALSTFAGKKGFGLKYNDNDDDNESNNLIPYADRQRESAKNMITGAIFKTNVDNTHPMAYGYSKDYFTLKLGGTSYSLLDRGSNVAHIGDDVMKVSGFAGINAQKGLKNSLVFGEERQGRGSIIYMVDNTLFRSFWENGKLFFVNAIFFANN
ncbi:M14 family metallopeptidase [Flavobacteriaceae bacterium S0825]|uniref:M14 metallopeptidase family protein n=1 Tax=Gaetbulibacter sp. S0825 TaxID=2720084 RepID=UPI001FCA614C|nr:M14 metallopeptidase family protein [Gaetbulibacter sp. S0825]MCK0110146.1 M14 family metallopeptidase [Flavobacteriaceae bacterium S0825]